MMLGGPTKWLKLKIGRGTDALKGIRDRGVWKVMMLYAKEQGT